MKAYELLSFNKELLQKIHSVGLKVDDCKYIDLHTEYLNLKIADGKITYIVSYLAQKYDISERQVYNIVQRMQRDILTANDLQSKTG